MGAGKRNPESLPWFASDDLLGAALLGADRIQEWRQIAQLLEARGLPKIDQSMGGRYVPAVRAFFDRLYGLDSATKGLAPDGFENFDGWKQRQRQKRPA